MILGDAVPEACVRSPSRIVTRGGSENNALRLARCFRLKGECGRTDSLFCRTRDCHFRALCSWQARRTAADSLCIHVDVYADVRQLIFAEVVLPHPDRTTRLEASQPQGVNEQVAGGRELGLAACFEGGGG